MERSIAPECHQQAHRPSRQTRGDGDGEEIGNLPERNTAKQGTERQDGQTGDQHGQDLQEAGRELADNDLEVTEIGHEQQNERASILFVRDGGCGAQGSKEQQQRELEHRHQEVQNAPKAGEGSKFMHLPPADQRLPGGPHQNEHAGGKRRANDVKPQRSGRRQHLARDDGSGEQKRILR